MSKLPFLCVCWCCFFLFICIAIGSNSHFYLTAAVTGSFTVILLLISCIPLYFGLCRWCCTLPQIPPTIPLPLPLPLCCHNCSGILIRNQNTTTTKCSKCEQKWEEKEKLNLPMPELMYMCTVHNTQCASYELKIKYW